MLTALLVSLFTYMHLVYFDKDADGISGHVKRIALLFGMALSLLCAYKNAQYTIIYASFLVIPFIVLLLIRKGIKRCLYYTVPVWGGGLFYLATQTNYLQVLFDFKNTYASSAGALTSTLDEIAEFKMSYLPGRITDMALIWGRYLFGSFFVMVAFAIVIIVMACVRKFTVKKAETSREDFSPFVIAIAFATMAYLVFFTAFGLYEQVRYISFVFPELAILAMVLAFRAFNRDNIKYLLVLGLILLEVLSVNVKGKVDMLYTGDRENIERIREYDPKSLILYSGAHTTFITYQAAYVIDKDAEFYVYTPDIEGSVEHLADQLRDNMVIVGYFGVDMSDVFDMLEQKGYQIEWLADTYQYSFHTATLKK